MHDKVSVVDGFSFWLFSKNFFQGGQNLLLYKLLLFLDQNLRRREVSEGEGTPVEETQATDNIV